MYLRRGRNSHAQLIIGRRGKGGVMVSPQGGWRRDRGRARCPGNSNCGQILHGIPSAAAGGGASGLLQSNCR